MLELLVIMLERVGTIVAVAFILTRFRFFKDMIHHDKLDRKEEITAILFFGFFGIIGTYFGVAFNTDLLSFNNVELELAADEAIANSRVIGIVVAGLLGGYRVGLGAGLIAGIHRMTLGGFTAISCGLSTIVAGVLAGVFYKKGKKVKPLTAFGIGALAEAMQMGVILLISSPFEKALALVSVIGVPMILANGVGTALFILIVHSVISEQEKTTALQAQKTLRIVNQTLGHLRKGMNPDTARAVCNILYRELELSAVTMTDKSKVLAYIGSGSDEHQVGTFIQSPTTKNVLENGELMVIKKEGKSRSQNDSSMHDTVYAPLTQRGETIGTLKLSYPSKKGVTDGNIQLIAELSALLSNQLEIAETDRAHQLAKETEIKALQAQISPHFLFNSINIINSLIRSDPTQARKLLLSLSQFLRNNMTGITAAKVSLEQELAHVKAYLEINKARFIDKLTISYCIDDSALTTAIPPFTLQPIVENAIHHGIIHMTSNCVITISVQNVEAGVEIKVEDNGQGIDATRLQILGTQQIDSENGTGMALLNVNRRLLMTFGEQAGLTFDSIINKGTAVSFIIPTEEVNS